ncbi:hypothetical protein SAOR_03015 [Salinisphaera orenii MK-B5]|uniref:Uncharacterized protein n=1 Tax=Salinisphaera orenii MK-B5 TaxID=856730 RepID=A0A423PVY3_9GAMM|nr:hypothetical protein [Salinisphaera orenii]ROO29767.1 hypothetical protein SAOR_03015 [Salinisphaera orenii MK-B5]
MADLERIARENDTSLEIVRAIADHIGDDADRIRETLDNPDDFDSIVTRALELTGDTSATLRWQGRAIG